MQRPTAIWNCIAQTIAEIPRRLSQFTGGNLQPTMCTPQNAGAEACKSSEIDTW
jgi:hypothetical protein